MMKSIRTLLVAGLMTIGLSSFAQNIVSENDINITINGQTSREELAAYAQQMRAIGVDFLYRPQFDGNRHLIGIEYTLKAGSTIIGTVEQTNLKAAGTQTKFHIVKANGVFTAQCLGVCND